LIISINNKVLINLKNNNMHTISINITFFSKRKDL
jgi:hypothetical protein